MAFTKKTASKAGKKSSRKGKPNRTTEEIQGRFKDLLDNNLEKIQKDLDQLAPKDRVKAVLELARFVVPTLKSTTLTDDRKQPSQMTVEERSKEIKELNKQATR